MKLKIDTFQNQGKRDYQEDNLLVKEFPGIGTFVAVTDGLGGHEDGEIASTMAVKMFEEILGDKLTPEHTPAEIATILTETCTAVHIYIREKGVEFRGHIWNAMATTIVGVFLKEVGEVIEGVSVSVGDSDLYVIYPQTTRATHCNRHHTIGGGLSQALGYDTYRPDVQPFTFNKGDLIIVASDGIETLNPDEIFAATKNRDMVATDIGNEVLNKQHAHQDNVTIISVEVQ